MSSENDAAAAAKLAESYELLQREIGRVIVGQQEVVEQLLISLFAGGHCLLEGVPGLAKTLMVRSLANALHLEFNRIQFTPDLMPSDITGTEIIQEDRATGERAYRFVRGPIFSNVILADEINRTPPKTQAALLESMQEKQVTAGGSKHALPSPFFVLATQNPIEQEGTYPLPEAQLDRFMFNVRIDYPSELEELEIVKRTTADIDTKINPLLTGEEILQLSQVVRRVPVADPVAQYAIRLVRLTRKGEGNQSPMAPYIQWGAGPRASQFLVLGAKARAILHGREFATTDDIKAVALPVLRHRIRTSFNADAEGITTDHVIQKILDSTPTTVEDSNFAEAFRSSDAG
ncbi:MoxR family ATPase [Bremerella cremea]|uniref:AAA family ATPase n=1 Tax=Blastopirellula marina TaxID=124 RepID=A0A2S8FQQ3_9BACT|nr:MULTISPECIES: MoxR family ATPase [Pirellulaceae]PQO34511.1 AAA family ATPase [Blastopirellula marina]RCS47007.1 MoxR family ATPase [Bremerella cremea]